VRNFLSPVQAGELLALLFALNASQMFKELEVKWSVMIHHVKVTHPLNWGMCFDNVFSLIAGLIVEIIYNTV